MLHAFGGPSELSRLRPCCCLFFFRLGRATLFTFIVGVVCLVGVDLGL